MGFNSGFKGLSFQVAYNLTSFTYICSSNNTVLFFLKFSSFFVCKIIRSQEFHCQNFDMLAQSSRLSSNWILLEYKHHYFYGLLTSTVMLCTSSILPTWVMAETVTAMSPFSTTGATGMSTCCCAPAGSCKNRNNLFLCLLLPPYLHWIH